MAIGLSKKQRQAIKLLSENLSQSEVMRRLKVARSTMFNWLSKKTFEAELQKAKETRLGLEAITPEKLGPRALAAINAGLVKGEPRIVLYVAEKLRLLDAAQGTQKKFKISFGRIPVDAPKPALKIVEMPKKPKQEQA